MCFYSNESYSKYCSLLFISYMNLCSRVIGSIYRYETMRFACQLYCIEKMKIKKRLGMAHFKIIFLEFSSGGCV